MQRKQLIKLASKIDTLSYYQLLGLTQRATSAQIKGAYHKRARAIHPDNFFNHPDASFRYAVNKIFKRVNEAYLILRDAEKKEQYDQMLISSDKKLRYTEEDDRALRKKKRDLEGETTQGRKYFSEAQINYENGDLKQACKALKMASTFEPGNKHFQELLGVWKRELKET